MGVIARDGSRDGSDAAPGTGITISFGERFAASDQFDAIFREGMALVERTAAYLDGPGRKEAKALPAPAALLYANESMRLTTRLLELASWLMIRRSHKEGEITAEQLARKRERVRLTEPGRISHVKGFETLPEGLQKLIVASFALNDRIVRLDLAMQVRVGGPGAAASPDAHAASPARAQVARLERAFVKPPLRAVPTSS
jgi:regulator of CtrA degradation